jgi:hypothetical protein
MAYLHHYYEPDTTIEQRRMQLRARAYQILDNDLYKVSTSGPLLCYVRKEEGQQILSEVQESTEVISELELWQPKSYDRVSIGQR